MKMNILLGFFSWLIFSSCVKNNDFPPFIYTPPVTDSTPPQYGTPFSGAPNRQDATIYQVNMRVFSAQGNFAGVTARLDSIKALGINVIYLMPIYPVGVDRAVNSPYAVKDYRAVNSEFGTLTDLRALVDGAHSRNMSVMLDWVANHTSWDNAWITAHKDWYLQNATGTILSPPNTNYTDVAQLNFTNATMRLNMISAMKYWVFAANVDGFRCDYADAVPTDFWKQAIDTLRSISTHKLLLLAEGSSASHYTAGFDYTFGFRFYDNLKTVYRSGSAKKIDTLNTTEYSNVSGTQHVIRYTTNHDVNSSDGTPLDLFGGKTGSMGAFAIAALMKGVPMVFNGQEVGTSYRLTFPFTGTKINWSVNPDVTADYKKILFFRNSSAAIRIGLLTSYSSADVCAFTKELNGEKVLVIVNLRNSTMNFVIPAALANTTWQNALGGSTVALSTNLSLPAYTYLILKNN